MNDHAANRGGNEGDLLAAKLDLPLFFRSRSASGGMDLMQRRSGLRPVTRGTG
jgi:hypothetical protein